MVLLNGKTLKKSSVRVTGQDDLQVQGSDFNYVSRGGLKLEKALQTFGVQPAGQICMDIGASTGGFTDVLLQNGAAKVYAIDVGTGQLHPSLACDPRVVSMEKTNARTLDADMFAPIPTLCVMDVSFISIKLILPSVFRMLGQSGRVIALIKPQFEAGSRNIGKNGIVTNPKIHEEVLSGIAAFAEALGWRVNALTYSPISGGSGNLEFLGDFLNHEQCAHDIIGQDAIRAIVRAAHHDVK